MQVPAHQVHSVPQPFSVSLSLHLKPFDFIQQVVTLFLQTLALLLVGIHCRIRRVQHECDGLLEIAEKGCVAEQMSMDGVQNVRRLSVVAFYSARLLKRRTWSASLLKGQIGD